MPMNQTISKESAINTCKSFLAVNEGDEATEDLILSIFCDLLNCSEDDLREAIKNNSPSRNTAAQ